MAVFVPFGGQMVTMGKSSSPIGWVVMAVEKGSSCISLVVFQIRKIAMEKLASTPKNQANLALFDLDVEMCASP